MEPDRTATPPENDGAGSECACFECGATADTRWREHVFPYGAGASAVELNVTLPVRVCRSCGFEFLDHEAETLQHEAVCAQGEPFRPSADDVHARNAARTRSTPSSSVTRSDTAPEKLPPI